MKGSKFISVISVLSFIFILIGSTFSFFTFFRDSKDDTVMAQATNIGAMVTVSALYNDHLLIPMEDDDIFIAFSDEYKCVDVHNYGACNAYTIDVENTGDEYSYFGTINFTIGNITNLNYMVLDEDDNVIVDKQRIISGEDMTLVDDFVLHENETKHFKLVIWLTNYDRPQDDEDASGTYGASVTFTTSNGTKITGSISG